ncbi:conserved membrane protein of unknown function [Methylacidimicrobium sp. AP8]|nr:conserved membrane protein of unknown function [Methylacidimicrobium sp. AP8]
MTVHGHGHSHGSIDPAIAASEQGVRAVQWSFCVLLVTAAVQFGIVLLSGSVALLADAIHNIGDAATALPLVAAFRLARRKPTPRFPYGLGRAEDLAGLAIVAIILLSALVSGYEAARRLLHPKPLAGAGWVAAAGVAGFLGNELVALYRIRVGRRIQSAALIADGYHARTDGLTSLAVVLGAIGAALGFPVADPLIGLAITAAILGILWQAAGVVLLRMLDGVEPEVVEAIRYAADHTTSVCRLLDVRARWIGHRLAVELDLGMDGNPTLREAERVSAAVERDLRAHLPALGSARIRVRPCGDG